MRGSLVAAGVAFIVIVIVIVNVADARAQPIAAKVADRAALRAKVVALRTEVEMLGLDYEIDRDDLRDDLKMIKQMTVGMAMVQALGGAAPRDAAGKQDEEKDARAMLAEVADRKKALAARFAALTEKRLDLADLERRHREAPEPAPAGRVDFEPPAEAHKATPIVEAGGACCLDPPGEEEVWEKLPTPRPAAIPKAAKFLVEKIGESIDPCKDYPLAGHCQLVHCHYRGTVILAEGGPAAHVFLDRDYLRRCPDAAHAPKPAPAPGLSGAKKRAEAILEKVARMIEARVPRDRP